MLASQATATLLDEESIRSDMVAVDGHSFGREKRQLAERIAFV